MTRQTAISDIRHPGLNLGEPHKEAHTANEELAFGFWVFMMSDLIVFGLLFATTARSGQRRQTGSIGRLAGQRWSRADRSG